MPNGSNRTEKQHYVPQVYLKGFAPQYVYQSREKNKNSKTKYGVFYYDLQERTQSKIAVPIKSVCFENDLYEVTGKNGEVVYDNRLENCFSVLEKHYSELRTNIEKKAFVKDNYKTKSFLSRDEKMHLMGYMTIQLLRTPTFLSLALKVAQEVWKNDKSEEQLKNIVRIQCLSFIDTYCRNDEKYVDNNKKFVGISDNQFEILGSIIRPMVGMSFMIGVDNKSRLITSDNPVYIRNSNKECLMKGEDVQNDEIIFPITASLCLIMVGGENKDRYPKNCLFEITDEWRKHIFAAMCCTTDKKIFSNHKFDKDELKIIDEVHKDEAKGDTECHILT